MTTDATKLRPAISVKPVGLEPARAALAATEAKITELKDRRRQQLLAGQPASSIAKIDAEIALVEHSARTEADRIGLLEAEARKQEQEAAANRRQQHINRFTKLLADADAAALELQVTVAEADRLFRRVINLRENAAALFTVSSSHAKAAKNAPEGAALSGGAIHALLRFELFRIGGKINVGGTPGPPVEQSFPGGLSPRIDQALRPESVTPFVDTLRRASKFAVDLLTAELSPSAAPPPAPPGEQSSRSPAQERLAQLVQQQNEAARDTSEAGEQKYQALVAEIAKAQAEAEGASNG